MKKLMSSFFLYPREQDDCNTVNTCYKNISLAYHNPGKFQVQTKNLIQNTFSVLTNKRYLLVFIWLGFESILYLCFSFSIHRISFPETDPSFRLISNFHKDLSFYEFVTKQAMNSQSWP